VAHENAGDDRRELPGAIGVIGQNAFENGCVASLTRWLQRPPCARVPGPAGALVLDDDGGAIMRNRPERCDRPGGPWPENAVSGPLAAKEGQRVHVTCVISCHERCGSQFGTIDLAAVHIEADVCGQLPDGGVESFGGPRSTSRSGWPTR
jgi:hypothetical protein